MSLAETTQSTTCCFAAALYNLIRFETQHTAEVHLKQIFEWLVQKNIQGLHLTSTPTWNNCCSNSDTSLVIWPEKVSQIRKACYFEYISLIIFWFHTFVKGASFQPFFWTITTALFETFSFFRGLLPLYWGKHFSWRKYHCKTLFSAPVDLTLICLVPFFMHSSRSWHIKICWSLSHTDD